MKVHIRKRQITSKGSSKPRYTLYLDIYYSKRKRKREFLGLYLEPNDTKTTRLESRAPTSVRGTTKESSTQSESELPPTWPSHSRSPTVSDLNGYNKKNKLGLKGLSPEDVEGWLTGKGQEAKKLPEKKESSD